MGNNIFRHGPRRAETIEYPSGKKDRCTGRSWVNGKAFKVFQGILFTAAAIPAGYLWFNHSLTAFWLVVTAGAILWFVWATLYIKYGEGSERALHEVPARMKFFCTKFVLITCAVTIPFGVIATLIIETYLQTYRTVVAQEFAVEAKHDSLRPSYEQKRREEQERLAEQKRREEQERLAEQKRREEQERLAEQKRREEQERLAEQKRREEQERLAEQKRREQQERRAEQKRREELLRDKDSEIGHPATGPESKSYSGGTDSDLVVDPRNKWKKFKFEQ